MKSRFRCCCFLSILLRLDWLRVRWEQGEALQMQNRDQRKEIGGDSTKTKVIVLLWAAGSSS
jgi:hypothetical protein